VDNIKQKSTNRPEGRFFIGAPGMARSALIGAVPVTVVVIG
jgi:hypothetical protein